MTKFRVFYGAVTYVDCLQAIEEVNEFCEDNNVIEIKTETILNAVRTSEESQSIQSVMFIVKYEID